MKCDKNVEYNNNDIYNLMTEKDTAYLEVSSRGSRRRKTEQPPYLT